MNGEPVAPAMLARNRAEAALRVMLPVAVLALGVIAWELVVRLKGIPPYVLPGPLLVFQTLVEDWGLLSGSLVVTLITTLQGFVLAVVGGVALAVLFNQSRLIEYSFYPYAVILQVTPIVAIAPLLLVWLPQEAAVLACAWIVAFFPVLANTTLGLNSVDHNLADLFRLYGASRLQVLTRLKLPAALPYILGGLKIAGGLSLIGAVVAEMAASSAGAGSGLAYRIMESGYRLNIPRMFAALVLLSVAGIVIYFLLAWFSHLMLRRWHESAVAREALQERSRPEREPQHDPERRHDGDDLDQPAMETERQQRRDHGERGGLEVKRQRIERKPAHRSEPGFGHVAEQDVQREPDREVEDHADDRGGDGGKRAREPPVGAQLLDERRAGEDPQHRRHEGDPRGQRRAEDAGGDRAERQRVTIGGEEADELRHQDQRPGRRFGEAQAVDHLRRGHPAVSLDRLLRHVGEQCIGAAEAHHRELGEEQPDAGQHVARAEYERDQRDRRPPDRETGDRGDDRLSPAVGRGRRQRPDVVLEAEQRRR
jgi:NitT/TauT family transport system permease protein